MGSNTKMIGEPKVKILHQHENLQRILIIDVLSKCSKSVIEVNLNNCSDPPSLCTSRQMAKEIIHICLMPSIRKGVVKMSFLQTTKDIQETRQMLGVVQKGHFYQALCFIVGSRKVKKFFADIYYIIS